MPSSGVDITLQAWAKKLHDGSTAVVVFNRGPINASVAVEWAWLDASQGDKFRVRDLHAREDIGEFHGPVNVSVGWHDARALRFYPVTPS